MLAATLLIAGVGTNTRQMFVPWLLMTVMLPSMFLINLFTSLFFFQFKLAGDLIVHDALISLVAFYFCTVVYNLYVIMELKQSAPSVLIQDCNTTYGTENVIFTCETGGQHPPGRDAPPSFHSIIAAQKERMAN